MYGRSLFWLFTHLNIQEKVWKDKTQIDNNGCPEDRCGGEGIRKVIRREGMKIFRFLRIYIYPNCFRFQQRACVTFVI